jgi:hypothetical protein
MAVTNGQRRDYALDFTRDMAAFSAFRQSGEQAFVAILKYRPTGKQAMCSKFCWIKNA